MKLKCLKSELNKAVNIVSKAVSAKTTMPILECIELETENNKLLLVGNDNELCITTNIPCKVFEEGKMVVNAKLFFEMIRRLPEEGVEIICDDEKNIVINSGKASFNLKGQNYEDFPAVPQTENSEKIALSQKTLRDMIKNTIFSVAAEDSGRPILTGELFDIRDGSLFIVALDRFRISLRKCELNNATDKKVTIPGKALNELQKILEGEEDATVSIKITGKHAIFEIEETTVITRLLEGNFLAYQSTLEDKNASYAVVNTKELMDGVDRAALISRESKNCPITFEVNSKKIIITSKTENESVYEEVETEYNGEPLKISFNPKYVLEALKAVDSEKISISLSSPLTPCIIRDTDTDNFVYLILPIRTYN